MKFLKLNIQLFGVSASNSKTLTASSGNKGTLSVSLAENSTNSSTNKSNITVTATFKMTSGGYSSYNTPRVEIWWYDNNGYTTITRKAYTNAATLARNDSVKATATFDVEHKADGTLSGYARANWVWDGSGSYCPPSGNVATSSTALTTILRGITSITSITDSTNYIDGTFTVTANPQASGKYYKIEWYIYNQNNSKYTICTDNLGTFATGSKTIQTKTFTSAQLTNIYANSTNTARPKLYAVVHTYNDSGYTTKIMSTEAKTIDVYLPESVKPTGSTTIADTVTKPSGLTDYVRGISKPSFAISITNNNGATISSCTIKLNGSQIKSWDTAATSYTYAHTEVLPNVTNPYEIEATDTRGRKYTASGNITALDYNAPIVDITSAERNSTTNTTIDLKINGTITALNNKNAKSFIIEKKLNTATTWDSVTTLTDYTYTNYSYSIPNCSADNIYNIRIRAVDSFGASSDNATVGTTFSLIDFKQGGKGLAFGKAATTDNLFECDLNAQFNKSLSVGGLTLLDLFYPVGSIYMSTTRNANTVNTTGKVGCPIADIGGTWERISGLFLLGANDNYTQYQAGQTGGHVTTSLTTDNLPAHTHGSKTLTGTAKFRDISISDSNIVLTQNGIFSFSNSEAWSGSHSAISCASKSNYKYNSLTVNATHTHDSVGKGTAFDTMPPFVAVYIWKRTG